MFDKKEKIMKSFLVALAMCGLWTSTASASIVSYDIAVTSGDWMRPSFNIDAPRPFGVPEQPTFKGTLRVDNAYSMDAALVGFNMVTGSQTWRESLVLSDHPYSAIITFDSQGNLSNLNLRFSAGSGAISLAASNNYNWNRMELSHFVAGYEQPVAMVCYECVTITPTPVPQRPPSAYQLLRNSVSVFDDTGGWAGFTGNYDVPSMSSVVNGAPAESAKGIGATFTPNLGYSLDAAANALGYDHFNWLQWATIADGSSPAFIDPPAGCYEYLAYLLGKPCPENQNRDHLPYYLDEQFSLGGTRIFDDMGQSVASGQTRLEQWTADAQTLLFSDSPTVNASFHTCLVGVRSDGSGSIFAEENSRLNSTCFDWVHTGGDNFQKVMEDGGGTAGTSLFLGFRTGGFTPYEENLFASYNINIVTMSATVPEPPSILLVLLGLGIVISAFSRPRDRFAPHVVQEDQSKIARRLS